MTHVHYLSGTRASTSAWKIVEVSKYLFVKIIDMSFIPIQTQPNLTHEAFDQYVKVTQNHSINRNFDVSVSFGKNLPTRSN